MQFQTLASLVCTLLLGWNVIAYGDGPATGDPRNTITEADLKRVTQDYDIWVDMKRKIVVLDGEVCLREGQLEMFACPKGTKEHESVLSLKVKPRFVHAALLAIGAKPGTPVKYDPVYTPATGPIIDLYVLWKDAEGKERKARAQDWVKQLKTEKASPFDWVFSGSGFWKDDDGKEYYYADQGDFICVSNFASAMLDLPVESSQTNSDLNFAAFTENIPPKGTKVRLILAPRWTDKKEAAKPGN